VKSSPLILQNLRFDFQVFDMPKLYEYFGIMVLFYSNEHEPIHVHGKYQGTESKAEIIIDNGKIAEIRFAQIRGKKPLNPPQFKDFCKLVEYYAEEIVQKWIDYFVLHKPIQSLKITQKIQ
jgi:hypothetical protein